MKRISYVCDSFLDHELDKIEQISDRSKLVHHLVRAYGLCAHMDILRNELASDNELLSFHSSEYIQTLKESNNFDDIERCEEKLEQFGFGYDCPLIDGIYDFVRAVVGSSITAAHSLVHGRANIAINWNGGWHHAQRDEARGFCYANDIVCSIHILRQKFPRVLYIDLDVHHGDGVENAFAFSPNVLTFSLHKYEVGFYPGTGAITDVGSGNGRFYSVNVPLKDGIRNQPYFKIFDRLSTHLVEAFQPDAIVVQCGCDCLAGDPLGSFNITLEGIGCCVKKILSWEKPSIFLGGGGYNIANSARCWTYLTSLIVGSDISSEIPDNPYFLRYGPCFDLEISATNRPDCNSEEYIENCITTISENISRIPKSS